MTRREGRPAVRRDENILSFVRPPAPATGADALDLVYQAAEIFNSIQNNAREIEARAHSMCKSAAERLKLAEQQTESAERSLREVVADADRKLAEASRVLTEVERRIAAAEDKATAAETRAEIAETEARKARQALALVEDAIRRRLLCAGPEAARTLHDVA
jgi:chromosome segregation ATPase